MLSVRNINVNYCNRVLFDDANLVVHKGELTAIQGDSGSGKTTLLYILGLISSFKDYTYCINDEIIDVNNQKIKAEIRKSQIGFIFQDKNLHDYLTIEENIKLYCLLSGHDYDENKVLSILEKVHLNLPLNTKCEFMSGGEKQRLAIACALIKDPVMIIADEPTSALDKKNVDIIISLLKDIAKEDKMVVIATHSSYVIDQCDCIYRIANHKLLCDDLKERQSGHKMVYRKMKTSFYKWYMKFQFGKSLTERLISLLLPVLGVSIVLSAYSIKDGLVESYKSSLNHYVTNEVLIKSSYNINNKTFNRLKSFNGVKKAYYSYETVLNEMTIDGKKVITPEMFYVIPYYDHQKEYFRLEKEYDGNVYLSYDMSKLINVEDCDKLYVETDLLVNKELDVGGIFANGYLLTQCREKYVIYVPYSYFNVCETNRMLMHLENFYVFDGIEEKIHKVNNGFKVSLSQDKYLLQMQQIENYEDILYKFSTVLLVLSVGILAVGQIYAIYNQRYELAVVKANGLTNYEIIKMMSFQCIKDILLMLGLVFMIMMVLKIILNCFDISFTMFSYLHLYVLLVVIILDYIIPTIISCTYICYFEPERILRF